MQIKRAYKHINAAQRRIHATIVGVGRVIKVINEF